MNPAPPPRAGQCRTRCERGRSRWRPRWPLHDGKHDRCRAPQPRPGHQQTLPYPAAEGASSRKTAAGRATKVRNTIMAKAGRKTAGSCVGRRAAKQEKDQNLRQARKSVEKVDQGRLMGNFGVSDQDARQIGPQVAVPPPPRRAGKGEQGRSHHENSIQPIGEREPAEHQNGQPRQPPPQGPVQIRPAQKSSTGLPPPPPTPIRERAITVSI